MNRPQLEHIIRAAAGNADTTDIVVVGSQAILGTYPDAPDELLVSMEADVFPRDRPEDSILIDGGIGERSIFHETFGYYAHGVDETTAWFEDRLIESIQDERLIGEFSSSSSIPGDFRLFGEGDQLDLMCSTFERVCYALGRAKSRKAVTPLLRWLDSEWGRDSAIEALGDIGDESVAPTLMKRLEAGDTSAARLITALGKLKYRPLISLLIARMDTDLKNDVPKQDGGENSLNALLNLQAKEAIPVVRAWAVHPKIYSQAQARRVLAHLENDDPIPALFLLLKDEKDEYRQCAVIEDLAATRSTRVLQPLLDAAKTSPHTSVRAAAMRGLGTIGSDESLHALTELSHTEFSGWQRVRGVTPQEIIAQVLEAATKQKLRLDFSAWETWLHDHPGFPEMTK